MFLTCFQFPPKRYLVASDHGVWNVVDCELDFGPGTMHFGRWGQSRLTVAKEFFTITLKRFVLTSISALANFWQWRCLSQVHLRPTTGLSTNQLTFLTFHCIRASAGRSGWYTLPCCFVLSEFWNLVYIQEAGRKKEDSFDCGSESEKQLVDNFKQVARSVSILCLWLVLGVLFR